MPNPHGRPRGANPSYSAMHARLARERGPARTAGPCADCGGRARDWSLRHGTDPHDTASYDPRCRRCHMAYDADEHAAARARGAATRSRRGKRNAAKLSMEQASEIRASREPTTLLAERYGVHGETVRRIRSGKTYRADLREPLVTGPFST